MQVGSDAFSSHSISHNDNSDSWSQVNQDVGNLLVVLNDSSAKNFDPDLAIATKCLSGQSSHHASDLSNTISDSSFSFPSEAFEGISSGASQSSNAFSPSCKGSPENVDSTSASKYTGITPSSSICSTNVISHSKHSSKRDYESVITDSKQSELSCESSSSGSSSSSTLSSGSSTSPSGSSESSSSPTSSFSVHPELSKTLMGSILTDAYSDPNISVQPIDLDKTLDYSDTIECSMDSDCDFKRVLLCDNGDSIVSNSLSQINSAVTSQISHDCQPLRFQTGVSESESIISTEVYTSQSEHFSIKNDPYRNSVEVNNSQLDSMNTEHLSASGASVDIESFAPSKLTAAMLLQKFWETDTPLTPHILPQSGRKQMCRRLSESRLLTSPTPYSTVYSPVRTDPTLNPEVSTPSRRSSRVASNSAIWTVESAGECKLRFSNIGSLLKQSTKNISATSFSSPSRSRRK